MCALHAGAKQSHDGFWTRPPQVQVGRLVGLVRAHGSTPIGGATKDKKPDHPGGASWCAARGMNDAKVAAVTELRDRWLEQVIAGEMLLEGAGKYDLSR